MADQATTTQARLKRLFATRDALLTAIENLAVEIAVTMQEGEPQPKRDAGPKWTAATLPGRLSSVKRHEDATSNVV